jgi:hypothetical protein
MTKSKITLIDQESNVKRNGWQVLGLDEGRFQLTVDLFKQKLDY